VKAIKIDSDVACRHCSQAIPDSDSDSGDEFGTRVSPYEQTGNESDHDVQRIQPDSNSDEPTRTELCFLRGRATIGVARPRAGHFRR
jgi:hypothetical protein